jgi:hypothetical protein
LKLPTLAKVLLLSAPLCTLILLKRPKDKDTSVSHSVQTFFCACQPLITWDKRPEVEADYSPPSCCDIGNTRKFAFNRPIRFQGAMLKHRGNYISAKGPGLCSRHSDWLRVRRPRGRSSSPGRVKNFLFSTSSRPALGSPTSYPMGTGSSFPGGKAAGA